MESHLIEELVNELMAVKKHLRDNNEIMAVNNALMLYNATKEQKYLEEAKRIRGENSIAEEVAKAFR